MSRWCSPLMAELYARGRLKAPHPIALVAGELRRLVEGALWGWPLVARRLTWRDMAVLASFEASSTGIQAWERRHSSQNGEDGIIAELVARVGAPGQFAVEIGASDGVENCTRHLIDTKGWTGAWFEGDPERVASACERYGHLDVRITQAFVSAQDVCELLDATMVPPEPDLLVIDVDGNDLWLWQAVAQAYRPRIVVIEYNGSFPPPARWVARYNPRRTWDTSRDYGASLMSLNDLARMLGYSLVGCDSAGVNSFWVRDDLTGPVHDLVGSPRDLYAPPRYLPGSLGHPRRPMAREPMSPLTERESTAVALRGFRLLSQATVRPGQPIFGAVQVHNGSGRTLSSGGAQPVHVALRWRGPDGALVPGEPTRSELLRSIPAGGRWEVGLEAVAPSCPGIYRVEPALVQETLRWWDGDAGSAVVEVREASP